MTVSGAFSGFGWVVCLVFLRCFGMALSLVLAKGFPPLFLFVSLATQRFTVPGKFLAEISGSLIQVLLHIHATIAFSGSPIWPVVNTNLPATAFFGNGFPTYWNRFSRCTR